MLGFLKKLFVVQTSEFEAKLRPTPECTFGGVGEIEVSMFSDGKIQLELSLKHSGAPDGARLDFYSGAELLGTVTVKGGYAKSYDKLLDRTLDISNGSPAELRMDGVTLYQGEFRPD